MIEPQDAPLSLSRQCELVGLPRSSFYYQTVAPDAFTLEVMHAIDRIYTDRPFYGVRRICKTLRDDGYQVNHTRVHRLMQWMGLLGDLSAQAPVVARQGTPRLSLPLAGGDGGPA